MDPDTLILFLSPHFDDIPLSCGGIAARLAGVGAHCIGITVFAAPHDPDLPLSAFAQKMHNDWERSDGMSALAINAVRRREEEAAMRLLGLHHEWLDFMDAPYRRLTNGDYVYTSDVQLFGPPPAAEERRLLTKAIADKVRDVSDKAQARLGVSGRVRVYAPLGVGGHVDHQLVFSAARRLGPRYSVLYYEDWPYASRDGALMARLNNLKLHARPRVTPITDLIGLKIASIARYKSQLDVLFGSADAMPEAVRKYTGTVAQQAGWPNGEYAERAWQLPPVYSLGPR